MLKWLLFLWLWMLKWLLLFEIVVVVVDVEVVVVVEDAEVVVVVDMLNC